jgi:serine/threonine-protein kinase
VDELLARYDAASIKPTAEELCRDCPELLEQVREGIEALNRIEGVAAPLGSMHAEGSRLGQFSPPPTPDQRYRVIRKIGEGGMGSVLLAEDTTTRKLVAIKTLRPEYAHNERAAHRFVIEAKHMQGMTHPNVLPILEVNASNPQAPFYVMPYVEAGSLARRLGQGSPLSQEEVVSIATQIADALAYAHDNKGLIHRDIKPENVLIDATGRAYLADFGLVRTVFNDTLHEGGGTSWTVGTRPYMAPEIVTGKAGDVRADIYSFGAMMYEMIAGRPPYDGQSGEEILNKVRLGPPPALASVNPNASPRLVRIVEGAMGRELRDRYAHMSDVLADLLRVRVNQDPVGPHGQATVAPPPPAPPPVAAQVPGPGATPRQPRSAAPIVAAAAAVLAMAGLAAVVLYRPHWVGLGDTQTSNVARSDSSVPANSTTGDGANPAPNPDAVASGRTDARAGGPATRPGDASSHGEMPPPISTPKPTQDLQKTEIEPGPGARKPPVEPKPEVRPREPSSTGLKTEIEPGPGARNPAPSDIRPTETPKISSVPGRRWLFGSGKPTNSGSRTAETGPGKSAAVASDHRRSDPSGSVAIPEPSQAGQTPPDSRSEVAATSENSGVLHEEFPRTDPFDQKTAEPRLIVRKLDPAAIAQAIRAGDAAAFSKLLDGMDADLNAELPGTSNQTPLALAIATGNDPIALELIARNVRRTMVDRSRGYSALHAAAFHNRPVIVRKLLELGDDPSARTVTGETPLQLAEENRCAEAAEILRQAGAR